jgi:hypothetical protein
MAGGWLLAGTGGSAYRPVHWRRMENTTFRRLMLGGLVAMVAGCGGTSDLGASRPALWVGFRYPPTQGPDNYEVRLVGKDAGGGCLSVSRSLEVTMNGKRMSVTSSGGESEVQEGRCAEVLFHGPLPAETDAVTTFVIEDDGEKYVAEFQNLLVPISLRLVSPADGLVRPGQTVVVDWQPATFKGVEDRPPYPRFWDATGNVHALQGTWGQGGSSMSIPIPAGVAQGTGELDLDPFAPAVSRCDFESCGAEDVKPAGLPVTISAP